MQTIIRLSRWAMKMFAENPSSEIRDPNEIRSPKTEISHQRRVIARGVLSRGIMGCRQVMERGTAVPLWTANGKPWSGPRASLSPRPVFGLLLAILLALAPPALAAAKLEVVATTADLGALAQAVGGERVAVTVLAKPTEDPHFVDAKPSFISKLSKADVLIEGGAELETGWLPPLLDQARNAKIAAGQPGRIIANEKVTMKEIPTALDRSKGDIHALGNPHYLVDPTNARLVAGHIAASLTQLDPASATTYQANLKQFNKDLGGRIAEWQKRLEPFKGRVIVSYHNSWIYFAEAFGLRTGLFLEPKPGIPPSPGHLNNVVERMKQEGVKVILADPYINRRVAERVAKETGGIVVNVTQYPGGVNGTEGGYIPMVNYLVNAMASALEKAK